MKLKKFNQMNESVTDKVLTKIGYQLENLLFKNIDDYFDYEYIEQDDEVEYYFYFNKLDLSTITNLCDKFKDKYYKFEIIGGIHDFYDKGGYQVAIKIIIEKDKINKIL